LASAFVAIPVAVDRGDNVGGFRWSGLGGDFRFLLTGIEANDPVQDGLFELFPLRFFKRGEDSISGIPMGGQEGASLGMIPVDPCQDAVVILLRDGVRLIAAERTEFEGELFPISFAMATRGRAAVEEDRLDARGEFAGLVAGHAAEGLDALEHRRREIETVGSGSIDVARRAIGVEQLLDFLEEEFILRVVGIESDGGLDFIAGFFEQFIADAPLGERDVVGGVVRNDSGFEEEVGFFAAAAFELDVGFGDDEIPTISLNVICAVFQMDDPFGQFQRAHEEDAGALFIGGSGFGEE